MADNSAETGVFFPNHYITARTLRQQVFLLIVLDVGIVIVVVFVHFYHRRNGLVRLKQN